MRIGDLFYQSRATEREGFYSLAAVILLTINKCLKGLFKKLSILDPEWAWRLIKITRRSDEPGEKRSGESCKLFKCDPNSILSETLFRVAIFEIRRFPVVVWTYKNGNFQKWCLREQESLLAWGIKKKCLTSLRIERFAYLLKKTIPLSGQLLKAACESRRPFGSYALLVPAPRKERLLFWNSKIARS